MRISEFQKLIEEIYLARDTARGRDGTFVWFVEEVGELARALTRPRDADGRTCARSSRTSSPGSRRSPRSPASTSRPPPTAKYEKGCPKCHETPCSC